MAAVKCGCVRALARAGAPSDPPHIDLCPLTSAVNLVLFPPVSPRFVQTSDNLLMRRPVRKLLKTWQLLASCEGGPSPSWQWHLNCPALAQWGSRRPPPAPPFRPCATTHTQLLNHTHISLVAVKGQTQWRGADWLTFLSVTGARSASLLNPQFLTQFPHPSRAKKKTQSSFSLTLIHAHTLSLWQPML